MPSERKLYTLHEVSEALASRAMPETKTEIPDEPIYPGELRAMSLHAPWAYMMAKGWKSEEYRSRTTKFRGIFLIHASQSKDSDEVIGDYNLNRQEVIDARSNIVGAARCTGSAYSESCTCHVHDIEDQIFFPEPIGPISGQIQQFWMPKDRATIKAFNKAWLQLKELGWNALEDIA